MKFFFFGPNRADGDASMKDLLGIKGANLAELSRLGIPIPYGFTIPTTYCSEYLQTGQLTDEFKIHVQEAMQELEKMTGCSFGHGPSPLLISVRSGAAISMPGMMETVLNLGINDTTVEYLSDRFSSSRFAYDTYRRFLQMYFIAVKSINSMLVEQPLNTQKEFLKNKEDSDIETDDLKKICLELKKIYREHVREDFPQDPYEHLWQSIGAVFDSWNCTRAKRYRQIHGLQSIGGTAVNICAMVFGNLNTTSGTGVCFTRDPSTGEDIFFGEYLSNAQGEDVVSGIRTPLPLSKLHEIMPGIYEQLDGLSKTLERHYRDLLDLEFTVEDGKLFILQARIGKRTARAAFKIAVDMVKEGVITPIEAVGRIEPQDFERLLLPSLDARAHKSIIGKGLAASPGAASGKIVFSAAEAERLAIHGDVLLVREETSPEDIGGIHVSRGLLTTRGGMTSHAAIVARQMGKCCVVGCNTLRINTEKKTLWVGGSELVEGDWITIDGTSGDVLLGKVATRDALIDGEFPTFLSWAREFQEVKSRANADNVVDAEYAKRLGAEEIGLCRTERTFFEHGSMSFVQQALLARNSTERIHALNQLRPYQCQFFIEMLRAMSGQPVCMRLFDHPLSEFLPQTAEAFSAVASDLHISVDEVAFRAKNLEQTNPALGHRGCRLGVTYPEIYEMQLAALAEATAILIEEGSDPHPQIMLPFVAMEGELIWARKRFGSALTRYLEAEKNKRNLLSVPEIPFGIMIETPRAAWIAGKLAAHADFFCISATDLTQLIYGMSRDDAFLFLRNYKQEHIMELDPLVHLDDEVVLPLIRHVCREGRNVKPDISIGVCTDHALNHESELFSHDLKLDYVSCSAFRVPITILGAARAALMRSNTR